LLVGAIEPGEGPSPSPSATCSIAKATGETYWVRRLASSSASTLGPRPAAAAGGHHSESGFRERGLSDTAIASRNAPALVPLSHLHVRQTQQPVVFLGRRVHGERAAELLERRSGCLA
jgi:hypothetical protein